MFRTTRSLFVLLVCLGILTPTAARAWVAQTQSVAAVKVATPPSLDPALTDPQWAKGTTFDTFYDFTTQRAAELKTTAYLLYDDKNLYVGMHCEQAGVAIVAAQTVDHAGIGSDDHVAFNLETSGSGQRVYQFRVNPHGIHDEYSSENARYAPTWRSIATVLPNGDWNAIMVIPLKDIRAQGGLKQHWQINIVRFVAASADEYTWAYEPQMQSVASSQYWPSLTDIAIAGAAARPQPYADVYGLASAGEDRGIFQNGIGNFEPIKPRPYGIDATVPITNTIAFVGTLNPDFSNVEQDQTTIAPQEFARQYNEYRPFFAQGANYLNPLPGTNINSADIPFYTPTIGVFNSGYKIEGTRGIASLGLLNVVGDGFNDTAYGYVVSRPDQSLIYGFQGADINDTGLRDDTFGFGGGTVNPHSGAFAVARYLIDRGTLVNDPGAADNLTLSSGIQTAHVLALVKYSDIGPQYNPVDGYLTDNDIRGLQTYDQYSGNGPKGSAIKTYQISAGGDRYVDRSGAAHQVDAFSSLSVTFTNLLALSYGQNTSELRTYAQGFPIYSGSTVLPFNAQSLGFGYRDGTPNPLDGSYAWGPFSNGALQPVYLQQPAISTSRSFGPWSLTLAYNGAVERALPESLAPPLDSQWERSVSVGRSFGKNASFAVALRDINGDGGFALPGTNFAVSFHDRFPSLDELYVEYGTPASPTTLNRFLVKYIFHIGGQTGT